MLVQISSHIAEIGQTSVTGQRDRETLNVEQDNFNNSKHKRLTATLTLDAKHS